MSPNNTIGENLTDKTVVITGASAGVGRAAARAFARKGAQIALIARDAAGLEATRNEIHSIGGKAHVFAVDMADAEAVFSAASECEAAFGSIDIWVNNAMTTVFSPVNEITHEEVRRVTEVTYLGYVHGTLAALRHMRTRDRGVIVQVGSSLAYRGIPLQAAYCGAKHAIRGFTDSLRSELLYEASNIKITAVHLPAVNTPQFGWARSRLEKAPRPVAPVYRPEAAARAIVHAASHPTREYWLGASTLATIVGNMLFPGLLDRYLAAEAVEGQHTQTEPEPDKPDNLFSSVRGGHRTDGAFAAEARSDPLLVSSSTMRTLALAGAGALIGLAAVTLGTGARNSRRRDRKRVFGR